MGVGSELSEASFTKRNLLTGLGTNADTVFGGDKIYRPTATSATYLSAVITVWPQLVLRLGETLCFQQECPPSMRMGKQQVRQQVEL